MLGLGRHCLPMSNKKDARPLWFNYYVDVLFLLDEITCDNHGDLTRSLDSC